MSDSDLKIHRVRFYNAELSSINSMAVDWQRKRLALIRRRVYKHKTSQTDAWSRIEIWNFQKKAPFLDQVIDEDCGSPGLLEAVEWTKDGRLLSCGLNALLNEYDLRNCCIKQSHHVTSGPAWCMATTRDKSMVAVGTEDGFVSIFKIDDQIEFDCVLDRHDKRILCLSWYQSSNGSLFIVGGSIDLIKIWKYENKRCDDFIKLSNDGTVVWCITVLDDFTIVSGDSTGSTCFWNGKTATLINSFKQHKADVLCLTKNADQTRVFSSGVDPIIASFTRHKSQWVFSQPMKAFHTHDVRVLKCVQPSWLFSGGIDNYLCMSMFDKPYLQLQYAPDFTSKIHYSDGKLLLQYEKFVELWSLGKEENLSVESTDQPTILPLAEVPVKLVEYKSKKTISSSKLFKNWIMYSTIDGLKILYYQDDGSTKDVHKVPVLYKSPANIKQMEVFGGDLIATNCSSSLQILKLDFLGVVFHQKIDFKHRIRSINATKNYLAVLTQDDENSIVVYDKNLTKICSLINNSPPCVFALNPFNDEVELWVVNASQKVVKFTKVDNQKTNSKEYTIEKGFSVTSCQKYNEINIYWPIKQLAFMQNSVLLSDDNLLYRIRPATGLITKCDKYRHVLKLVNLEKDNQLIIAELTPDMLFNRLPAFFGRKKFGM